LLRASLTRDTPACNQRVAEALQESSTRSPEEAVQIMREDTMGGSPFIHDLLSSINVMKKLDTMLRQADTNITVSRLLFFCGIAGLMAGLAAYTVAPAAIAVLAAIIASLLADYFCVTQAQEKAQ
jgi:Flp pilus assembly protein TadB